MKTRTEYVLLTDTEARKNEVKKLLFGIKLISNNKQKEYEKIIEKNKEVLLVFSFLITPSRVMAMNIFFLKNEESTGISALLKVEEVEEALNFQKEYNVAFFAALSS